MELSDRLNLLSLVAAIWLMAAVLLGVAVAFGVGVSAFSGSPTTPDENFAPVLIWMAVIAAPAWLCSWAFITLVMFGSRTTLRGRRLSTGGVDVPILVVGCVGWTVVAFSFGYRPFLVAIGVLGVAVAIGLAVLVWRLAVWLGAKGTPS